MLSIIVFLFSTFFIICNSFTDKNIWAIFYLKYLLV